MTKVLDTACAMRDCSSMEKTHKQQLAEMVYPGDLAADVANLLAAGHSYRDVSLAINANMPQGFTISREAVRRYYGAIAA